MRRVGILGGTGFGAHVAKAQELQVETAYGDVTVSHLAHEDADLFFIQRHGPDVRPPHRIAHRANIDALARCRVDAILALNSVGALHADTPPGSFLVPDDFLDLRKTTETFHDQRAVHVDLTEPYCPHLRAHLARHAAATGRPTREGGVYACVEGPRLETPAEIRAARTLGGTVIGMTGCPEAALARERALCYASLCLVTNPAAGLSDGPLSAEALKADAGAMAPDAWRAVLAAASAVDPERTCGCRHALDTARL